MSNLAGVVSSCSAPLADEVQVDAIRELGRQNDELRKELEQQRVVIEGLRSLVCKDKKMADVCKEEK